MTYDKLSKKISIKEILILLLLLISGSTFVGYIWRDTKKQEIEKVLQVARSVEACLPKENLKTLDFDINDLKNKDYQQLKSILRGVVRVNKNAKFAYLYIQRNDKLYFIVDSEPENSPDYSPPRQEFTEADATDKKPFQDGKALVTEPVTDRWGTWVSAEVPVFDTQTGKVLAVFGMDYNAKSLKARILYDLYQSLVLFVIALIYLQAWNEQSQTIVVHGCSCSQQI
jgi:sensor histidine kinase regulating citrate/malate metabolism